MKKIHSLYVTSKDILVKERYIIKFYNELKDEVICFLDKNKNIKIYSSICPHFGGEIYYDKKNDFLRCKWHDWKFSKDTGKCLSYPIKLKLNPYDFEVKPNNLKKYNVKLESNEIYLNYEKE